ncbi:Complexin-1 [Myotis brandtii]|uniref:Complexin-1 n=2 Tax=Chiroptera TaxID=9397 RepID=S7NRY1_MYOBR|nr:Complexin-1 [Myotis brandtii]
MGRELGCESREGLREGHREGQRQTDRQVYPKQEWRRAETETAPPAAPQQEGRTPCGRVRRWPLRLCPAHHVLCPGHTPSASSPALTPWATKDMGKMLGGDEEKDPDAAKKEEERQEALRQEEEERKAKYAKMEAEREAMRQGIRDKYGIKKKEEREAEAQAAMEANAEGSLTRPKKAIPPGCGDEPEEEDESILDTVIKYLPGPLQDMFKK